MKKINIHNYKSIVFFTGRSMAEEAGVMPYRQSGGIWNAYHWEDYACEKAYVQNPLKVLEFHEKRRKQILACEPHNGYYKLVDVAEKIENTTVITQNIDGLHNVAGSRNVIELNGNIWEVTCPVHGTKEDTGEKYESYSCRKCGNWLRPAVTWFGDMLNENKLHVATDAVRNCDLFVSIGVSGDVWPAKKLAALAKSGGALCVEINSKPTDISDLFDIHIRQSSSFALPQLFDTKSVFKRYWQPKYFVPVFILLAFFVGYAASNLWQSGLSHYKTSPDNAPMAFDSDSVYYSEMMNEAGILLKSNDYVGLIEFVYNNDWQAFDLKAKSFLKQAIFNAVDTLGKKGDYDRAILIIRKYMDFSGLDSLMMKKLAALYVVSDRPFLGYDTYLKLSGILPENALRFEVVRKAEALRNSFFKKNREEGNWKDIIAFCDEFSVKEPEIASLYKFEKAKALVALDQIEKARILLEDLLYDDRYYDMAESYLKSLDGYRIPIIAGQDQEVLFVNASINGLGKAVLVIDTGATMVCLSYAAAQRAEIFVAKPEEEEDDGNAFASASGSFYAPVEIADSLSVGNATINNIAVVVKDIKSEYGEIDGLLGMNFLKHFDFSIDLNENILHLKRKKY